MLPLAVLGLILWILLLLWRINTKTAAMPVKGEESPSGCTPPAAEEDMPTKLSPHPGEHSLLSASTTSTHDEENNPQASSATAGLEVSEALQASSEINSKKPSSQPTTQNPSRTNAPMLSSGPEARERLKFILGASEDNSSDEEPLVNKPPSGASQGQTTTPAQQTSSAERPSSSSGIK